jgi:hypothetical protein
VAEFRAPTACLSLHSEIASDTPRCGQDAGVTAAPGMPETLGSLQGFVDLGGIHDLLEANDLAVLDGPDVREAG